MIFKNKKFILIGAAIVLTGLFFIASASSVLAAGCGEKHAQSSFLSFLNPVFNLVEKVARNFGYEMSLAAAPDPDFCGSDSVDCSGTTSTAVITWTAAPNPLCSRVMQEEGEARPQYISSDLYNYVLTVGSNNYTVSKNQTSYTISSGLANNTTYNWSVEAYYTTYYDSYFSPSSNHTNCGRWTNQPHGSFRTSNCIPTCVDTSWSPDPSAFCLGESFTQTSNCNNTRQATGTKDCDPGGITCQRCSVVRQGYWAIWGSGPDGECDTSDDRYDTVQYSGPDSRCTKDKICERCSVVRQGYWAIWGSGPDGECDTSDDRYDKVQYSGPDSRCGIDPPIDPPICSPDINYGSWSACSAECHSGTQSRSVLGMNADCSYYVDTEYQSCYVPCPPVCGFIANPAAIILPQTSTLSWSCIYAGYGCSINQGIGSVNNVSGSKEVRPQQTTTYTLSCSGIDGSGSWPATVGVGFLPWIREVIPR